MLDEIGWRPLLLFGRVSLAAPLVNLLVVPVFSFVTVPAVLAGILLDGPVAPLGDALLRLSAASLALNPLAGASMAAKSV